MTHNLPNHDAIKASVALRAKELGASIIPEDVMLNFLDINRASGFQAFRANWGVGESYGVISGLIRGEDQIDTYPMNALSKVFQYWLETGEKKYDAKLAAQVTAFILDPLGRQNAILSDKDRITYSQHGEWFGYIKKPRRIDVDGYQGVEFWWVGYDGASQVRVYLDESQLIKIQELFIEDILAAK